MKHKHYSKKEKAAAVVVSSALMSMPFLYSSSYEVQALDLSNSSTPINKTIDKLGNMIVPANGNTATIDLKTIYQSTNNVFLVSSDQAGIAVNQEGYSELGLLKINPLSIGTATFTVIYNQGIYNYLDTFTVTVDSSITSERKFDITDTVKKIINMPSDYNSVSSVETLLAGIGPSKTPGISDSNSPPTLISALPSEFTNRQYTISNEIHSLGNLANLFTDLDGDTISVSVKTSSGNSEIFREGDEWFLAVDSLGTTMFTIVARDGRGGVKIVEPFTIKVVPNHAPVLKTETNPFIDYEFTLGQEEQFWDLNHYFSDPDGDALTFSFTATNISGAVNSSTLVEKSPGVWALQANAAGVTEFKITATDTHNESVSSAIFTVTVSEGEEDFNDPPLLSMNNVLTRHFLFDELPDPVLHLSQNADIDLSEMFFDEEEDPIHYEVVVEKYISGDTTTHTINIGTDTEVSWESLSNVFPGELIRINQIRAFDSEHPNDPNVIDVDIVHGSYNPFPESLDMYKSNAAGISSYILDYQSVLGFGGNNYTWIDDNDIINNESNAVTASVYESKYLKFDAKDYTTTTPSKIKIYAHDSESPSILYQDDFNFRVISPEDTLNPDTNLAAISPRPLYPHHDNNYWAESFNFRNYVSVVPATYNDESSWTFETGSFTMRLTEIVPTGTQVVFKIDPDSGSRVFYVPYIKPAPAP